jgi:hypothetical protein
MQLSEKVRFIEGVGGNLSLIYKDNHISVMMVYLLCSYKDGIQIYSNSFFSGQCWVVFTNTNDPPSPLVKVYPTIFSNQVIIDHPANEQYTRVVVHHSGGGVVFSTSYTRILKLPGLLPGTYFITLYSKKGNRITRKLIRG